MELIALILFPLLIVTSIRITKPPLSASFFGKDQTCALKGILALLVFFHHFFQTVGEPMRRFRIYAPAGSFAVGIFYLIAGYVTLFEFQKQISFRDFCAKKIVRLYLPLTIFEITTNHFLRGILWLYLFSWIAFTLIDRKYRIPFLILCNILYIPLCRALGNDIFWYDRILPFSIGILIAQYRDVILLYLQKKWIYLSCLFVFGLFSAPLFLCLYFYRYRPGTEWMYYSAFTVSTSLLISVLMYRFTIKSKIFDFLGKLSFEFFLLHEANIVIFMYILSSPIVIALCSIAATTAESYFIQRFWNKKCAPVIFSLIKGK